jgi:hypothetical protein
MLSQHNQLKGTPMHTSRDVERLESVIAPANFCEWVMNNGGYNFLLALFTGGLIGYVEFLLCLDVLS